MMMSKPEGEKKPKGPSNAVAALEKRLAMLGSVDNDPPPPMSVAEAQQQPPPPPAYAVAPPPAAAPVAPASGKSALLARIKKAQEKAKGAKPKEELPPPDFFGTATAPPSAPPMMDDLPPPAFDDAALLAPPSVPPPQEDAPPAFSLLEETFDMSPPPPPAAAASAPPSYATAPPSSSFVSAPPEPSAPSFEDLVTMAPPPVETLPPPPMPSVMEQSSSLLEEEFAAALAGMSPEEKASLMAEQRQIMEQIEKEKSSGALSAADRFDQRSNAAVARIAGGGEAANQRTVKLGENQEVALHGQEKTRAAIADGTALLVQCVNCNNWMQVTDSATMMFCPVCQVVSPVDRDNAVMSKEAALQMEADRKLAEELQNEEYTAGERRQQQQPPRRTQQQSRSSPQRQRTPAPAPQTQSKSESWWDWLGLGGGSNAAPAPAGQQQDNSPQYRGDLGVSRPPGAGLQAVQTGEISFDDEAEADGRSSSRTAESSKSLFASVADSMASLTTNTQTLTPDDDGNVHGVDGSSLLAVSKVGRNQG